MIAKNLDSDKQLFISTHSEHFLKGLIENSGERLTVVRIERSGDTNSLSILESTDLKAIWHDSLLKHSNILDGLFHSKVVLCESDSDARFFSAVTDVLVEYKGLPAPDIHFIHCGGKAKFPIVIKAFKKINVPLTVIGDFDLFNNQKPLRDMFEAMGGNWQEVKTDFEKVKSDIDSQRPELNSDDFKKAVIEALKTITEDVVSDGKLSEIKDLVKKASAWTKAKMVGKEMLRSGPPIQSYINLNKALLEKHIVVLEFGELESLDKRHSLHGPAWTSKVLELDVLNDSELERARYFVLKNILNQTIATSLRGEKAKEAS
ncbi:MAG: TOPRIM nucleotidyl transferase/hydrolase domain-containing protein [Bacteroidota bacterium]